MGQSSPVVHAGHGMPIRIVKLFKITSRYYSVLQRPTGMTHLLLCQLGHEVVHVIEGALMRVPSHRLV